MGALIPLAVNLAGSEHPTLGSSPFAVDRDGAPYVPVGDGGLVLGLELGDGVFEFEADHAAPGATLIHPDAGARHALTAFACLGNDALLRSGPAAGERGRVLGKRGGEGRVIVVFPSDVMAQLAPGDSVLVRGLGQGCGLPAPLARQGAVLLNCDPDLLRRLHIDLGACISADVRAVVPSLLIGNGLGRPAQQWDLDLTVTADSASRWGLAELRLGDLVAVTDLDVRHNAGFRAGWLTIGVVVHGASPLPGHGPGLMPILCGPAGAFDVQASARHHQGVTYDRLWS